MSAVVVQDHQTEKRGASMEVSSLSSTSSSPSDKKVANLATKTIHNPIDSPSTISPDRNNDRNNSTLPVVPLSVKLLSVLLVSCIGFGSQWSSGVTGAMKSTIKKEMHINNTQFSLLEASEDFMSSALILVVGIVTDRLGGSGAIVYGNLVYTLGSILVAGGTQTRSFKFMIVGRVILAFGDIATQVAQYKVFSSWFPPNHGFASTLGFELGLKKIGGFVGKSTANIIAKRTGDFAWVFWTAVFMNLFTNVASVLLFYLVRWSESRYAAVPDPSTGEALTERNRRFEIRKLLELPWVFWAVMGFGMFQTCAALVFSQNATELAEMRFKTDAVTAGWYSATAQYAGFFFVPVLGVFIDVFGQRISIMLFCSTLLLISMSLVSFCPTTAGTAASFGIYAFAYTLGPTTIIDSVRTCLPYQSVFGSAYAVKIAINNAMSCIIRILTGVLQDADDNSYDRVTRVYVFLTAAAWVVAVVLFVVARWRSVDLDVLQWGRKTRLARGEEIVKRKEERGQRMMEKNGWGLERRISLGCFAGMLLLMLGGWIAYFWGVATGNNA